MRDALEYGPMCPQGNGEGNQSEDCLVVNIWTRGLNDGGRRPVMLWLHGGGYAGGTGADPRADGVNLCNRGDVVVVTINNRVNVFGWLYLAALGGDEYAASGAAGMLDQVQALTWIRDNIARFGGDPGNVTIWGIAGGARKTSTLLAMPSAKGLFHRAIIESGAQLRIHPPDLATEMAVAVMAELGLKPNQVSELRSVPFQKLNQARAAVESRQDTSYRQKGVYVQQGFVPAVDGRFIPTHNCDPFYPATSADVPLLIGTNKHESGNFLKADPKIDSESLTGEELLARAQGLAGTGAARLIEFYRTLYPKASPGGDVRADGVAPRLRVRRPDDGRTEARAEPGGGLQVPVRVGGAAVGTRVAGVPRARRLVRVRQHDEGPAPVRRRPVRSGPGGQGRRRLDRLRTQRQPDHAVAALARVHARRAADHGPQ